MINLLRGFEKSNIYYSSVPVGSMCLKPFNLLNEFGFSNIYYNADERQKCLLDQ